MSLVDWDNELTVVSSELATIREAHTRTRMTGNKALVARKVAIIQMQINVERNFARIKKLVGRDLMLMPRERTLVHWSQVFLEHAEKFHALRSKLLTRGLWLKLIMTRAMGPEGDEHGDKSENERSGSHDDAAHRCRIA